MYLTVLDTPFRYMYEIYITRKIVWWYPTLVEAWLLQSRNYFLYIPENESELGILSWNNSAAPYSPPSGNFWGFGWRSSWHKNSLSTSFILRKVVLDKYYVSRYWHSCSILGLGWQCYWLYAVLAHNWCTTTPTLEYIARRHYRSQINFIPPPPSISIYLNSDIAPVTIDQWYPFSLCAWTRYHFHPSLQWQICIMGKRAEQSYLIYCEHQSAFFHATGWIHTDVINSTLRKYLLLNWNFTKMPLLLIIIDITMLSLFYSL